MPDEAITPRQQYLNEVADWAGNPRPFEERRMAPETAWLIEINEGGIPIYFHFKDDDDWTADHNAALRLSRREDAQQVIDYYGWTSAKPVEHMWCAAPGGI